METYLKFVRARKTLVFCASVRHAEEVARLFREEGLEARAVSGSMKDKDRNKVLADYESGRLKILCACDLLNEGWDSPSTEVLFMARPTLSKLLYEQQLGRGLRLYKGKDYLMVFDFIDNANIFNMPYSVHRIFEKSKYIEGGYVAAPKSAMVMEEALIYRGEKPNIELDYPVEAIDYEIVDLFNWQDQVADMISEINFVRMVNVQSETISKYIREEKIKPDLSIPMTRGKFNYFYRSTVDKYIKLFGWKYIGPENMKASFMDYIETMSMSYSYKPVFIVGFIESMGQDGRVKLDDLVDYFIDYYETRRERGLVVEKKKCLYLRDYTRSDVRRNILSNPFKRFQDMGFIDYDKDLDYLKLNRHIKKKLGQEDYDFIRSRSREKLQAYFED